jgi:hypothetical protein
MIKKLTHWHVLEFLCPIFLGVFIYHLYRVLLLGNFIYLGYADWLYHIYRLRFVQEFGITTWTYLTEGGQDFWQAYQFLIYYFVLGFGDLFNLTLTKASLYLTFIGTYFLYFTLYAFLRYFSKNSLISFYLTILSVGVLQQHVMIGDYSMYFGYTLVPLLTGFIWIAFENNIWWLKTILIPFIALSILIHPILGFFCAGFWGINVLFDIHLTLKHKTLNFLLLILCGAQFWVSGLFYDGLSYIDDFFTSTELIRFLVMKPENNWGFSFHLLLFIPFTLFLFVTSLFKFAKNYKVLNIAVLYLMLLYFWFLATLNFETPGILNRFQITRWLPYLLLLFMYIAAHIYKEYFKTNKNLGLKLLPHGILLLSFLFINIDARRSNSSMVRWVPIPSQTYEEPIDSFFTLNPEKYYPNVRVFAPDSTTTALFNFNEVLVDGSYFHFTPNFLTLYRNYLVDYGNTIPDAFDSLIKYFRMRGVKYFVLSENKPSTFTFLTAFNTSAKVNHVAKIQTHEGIYHVYELLEKQLNSYAVSNIVNIPTIDNSLVLDSEDQIKVGPIKTFIQEYYDFLENAPLAPRDLVYLNQESILVPYVKPNEVVVLYMNFDNYWVASDAAISISKVGPNFIGLTSTSSDVINDVVLTRLQPKSVTYSRILTLVGVVFTFVYLVFKIAKKKK